MPLVKHDYPVLEYDTASKAVFQPGNGKKCFPAKAVFAFLGDEVENYAHTHDGIQIDEFESATRRYPIYECLYNQEKICLCPAPVGSAAAVQVLEYLIAGGVTKIISVGSCGVLEDIPENRFLIPVSALRDEGTSYHYLPPSREVEISKAGINAIESALSQKNIPYWEVKTWTTDGFYRETVEMVQYRKEEGCQVVEMECSALAACAKFRKVTWAMLLFSADTLADPHKYQEREWGKTSISIALDLALDAVYSVVEEKKKIHIGVTMNGLRPDSDIDILIITKQELSNSIRADLTKQLLKISGSVGCIEKRPLEVTIINQSDIVPLQFPPKCQYMYGEWLRGEMEAGEYPQACNDPDIMILLWQARKNSITLKGAESKELIPAIPFHEIKKAIRFSLPGLISSFKGDERNVLLTLSRMWFTLVTEEITTKDVAAKWVILKLPERFPPLLTTAKEAYLGNLSDEWETVEKEAMALVEYMKKQIEELLRTE